MPAVPAASQVNPVSVPPTTGGGNSSGAPETASQPFSAVLAHQVSKPASSEDGKTSKAAQTDASDPGTATPNQDLAAMLPMLMNSMQSGALTATNTGAATTADTKDGDASNPLGAMLATPVAPTAVSSNLTDRGASSVAGQSGVPTTMSRSDGLSLTAGTTDGHPDASSTGATGPANVAALRAGVVTEKGDAESRFSTDATSIQPDNARLLDRTEPTVMAVPTPSATPVSTTSASEYRIAAPVGSHQWESAITNSVVLMTGNRQERAELVLNPPQLGRIEVSVSMSGDQANATFVSSNPAVREALENALPRLKEVLADAGITLGQAQVGSEWLGQSANNQENGDNFRRTTTTDFGSDGTSQITVTRDNEPRLKVSRGLVDVFA